jgi:hypothetical protein
LRTTGAAARYGLNVDAMLADITPDQFNEWIAYHQLEPWGNEAVQTAVVASAVHNAAGNNRVSPLDFLPDKQTNGQDIHATAKRIGGVK